MSHFLGSLGCWNKLLSQRRGLQEPLMCWGAAQMLWQPGDWLLVDEVGSDLVRLNPFIFGIWRHHTVSEVSAEHPTSDLNMAGMGALSCILVTDMFFVGCDCREEKRCVFPTSDVRSRALRRVEEKSSFFSYCTGCHLLIVEWYDSFTQKLPQPALPVLPLHFQAT